MKKNFDAVLFDFDGTFADTGEGIFKSIRKVLADLNMDDLSDETLHRFIGPPIYQSFVKECGLDDETTQKAVDLYRSYYGGGEYVYMRVYDGMIELIKELRNNGIITAVASSKPEKFLKKIIEDKGFTELFDVISGTAFDKSDADKTVIIQKAISECGLPETAKYLMVGDRCYDIQGAKGAGIPCACVLFGYGSKEEFTEYDAEYIVKDTDELKSIILCD